MLVDDLFPQDRVLAEVGLRRGDQTFTDPRTGQPYDIDMPVTPAAQPGAAGAAKPEVDVNVDKIVSAMRKLQPAGTKPLPPTSKIAQEITKDLANVALNKDYLIRVGDKILKLNNAGYDVKNLHQQFMGQYAKGNKQKTISEDSRGRPADTNTARILDRAQAQATKSP